MALIQNAFDDDSCPVQEELLGEMYRASAHGLPMLVDSIPGETRAMLALFCYRRSHLHSLALAIAATCSERDLIQIGGRPGGLLYSLAREAPAARQPASGGRKPVTLSTAPLSPMPAPDDEIDADSDAPVLPEVESNVIPLAPKL
jgi:hypothetical protein